MFICSEAGFPAALGIHTPLGRTAFWKGGARLTSCLVTFIGLVAGLAILHTRTGPSNSVWNSQGARALAKGSRNQSGNYRSRPSARFLVSGPDIGRILIGRASTSSALRPAGRPMLRLSRSESGHNLGRKSGWFPARKHYYYNILDPPSSRQGAKNDQARRHVDPMRPTKWHHTDLAVYGGPGTPAQANGN